MRKRQRIRFRLTERYRRARRLLAIWRRRDPKAGIIALVGMAMGLSLFLMTLVWVGILRVVAHAVRSLR